MKRILKTKKHFPKRDKDYAFAELLGWATNHLVNEVTNNQVYLRIIVIDEVNQLVMFEITDNFETSDEQVVA